MRFRDWLWTLLRWPSLLVITRLCCWHLLLNQSRLYRYDLSSIAFFCMYQYLYTLLCSERSVASTHCEPGCLCTEQNNTAGCVSIAIRWLCCRPSSSGLCSSILRELCVPIWRLASLWSHASQCDVQLNGKRANSDDWLPALCSSCTFNVGVLLGELCNHRNQCANPWADH